MSKKKTEQAGPPKKRTNLILIIFMKEAVEEGRGRRYKEGDRMVEGGILVLQSILGERIFLQKKRVRKVME